MARQDTDPKDQEVAGLALFSDMVASLAADDPVERTLEIICRKICELARFRFCGVLVPDDEWRVFRLAGGYGFPPEYIERLNELFLVPVDDQQRDSPTRRAAELRSTVVNSDVLEVPEFLPWRKLALEFGYQSMVSVPLVARGKVLGVLNGYSPGRREFTRSELRSVETLAAQAAITLRLSMLMAAHRGTIEDLRHSNLELERQRLTLVRVHEIHQALTAAAVAGTSSEAIADRLSALIDSPVAILDPAGGLRCGSTSSGQRALDDLVGRATVARSGRPRSDADISVAEIRIPGEHLGYVVVPRGTDTEDDLNQRAAEHAATILALEAVKERVVEATEERLQAGFLSDLLLGRLDEDASTVERATRHRLSIGAGHRVVMMRIGRLASDPDASVADSGTVARVQRELRRLPGAMVLAGGSTLSAVVPADPAGTERLCRQIAAIQELLEPGRPTLSLAAGIGSVARTIPAFAESYRDAESCLGLARHLDKPGLALARDDLGILGLFIDTKRPELLAQHASSVLGPALDQDRAKGTDLVGTLTAWLDAGQDLSASAGALHVHPNTVKYRLRRLEELCDLNLRTASDLLRARVATLTLTLF